MGLPLFQLESCNHFLNVLVKLVFQWPYCSHIAQSGSTCSSQALTGLPDQVYCSIQFLVTCQTTKLVCQEEDNSDAVIELLAHPERTVTGDLISLN